MKRDSCLAIIEMTTNQFYHTPSKGKAGRKKSSLTKYRNPKSMVVSMKPNEDVVMEAIGINLDPDHANWYRLITRTLNLNGYYINHKKLYRLLQEFALLEEKPRPANKKYVKYRKVTPTGPLQVLEMDIKHIWIYSSKRYCYVFTILDTFTRFTLYWDYGYSMKSDQIKDAWEFVIANFLQNCTSPISTILIVVRSDNGPQFEAHVLKVFFEENNISHEFTHPYTPEENGHIESFHSILTKAIESDHFEVLSQIPKRLTKFYSTYNDHRSHSGIKGLPPAIFWALIDLEKIEVKIDTTKKQDHKVWLKVAYQDILTLKGIDSYQHRAIRG